MKCYSNISQIITLQDAYKKDGRNLAPSDLSIVKNGAIVFDSKKILWVGSTNEIPSQYQNIKHINLEGHTVVPEIVDSHTHLVFGGDRSFEYTMRLNGASYEEIAKAGGGILSTMENTIIATEDELFHTAVKRIEQINSYGVGTIEIKSGYGLTHESERKISKVIHRLKEHFVDKVQIINTFLAAHAVPGGFESSQEYINKIVIPLLHELHQDKIIDFVDIFHEENYFDYSDSKYLFEQAQKIGLPIKIHADEFNDNKGAILGCIYSAASADHLLCTSDDGIDALSKCSTVATLLPGTAFFLGKPLADARKFLDAGCKVAIASDYNPGSCHCDNLLLIASIAAKSMKFNIAELWAAISLNSAHALNLDDQGVIVENFKPRFSIFKTETLDEITYSWGKNLAVNI